MSYVNLLEYDNMVRGELDFKTVNFEYTPFHKLVVSTKVFIVVTNLIVDIQGLFKFLPTTEYIVVPKKRGRKGKKQIVDPNIHIPNGAIISLEYQDQLRGVRRKPKKNNNNKYFRNSLTVIMKVDNKFINFKISQNGKQQMTGCKYDEQAEQCIKYFWDYIKDNHDLYTFASPTSKTNGELKCMYVPAMRNVDFSLNSLIDREKLDHHFNMNTDYYSLLETSFGYTGVNIKFRMTKDIQDLKLKTYTYDTKSSEPKWSNMFLSNYSEYLDLLNKKDRLKKVNKQRYNTFLAFHSGKVIMSGMEYTYMIRDYYNFLKIVDITYPHIIEKLEKKKT